MKKALIVGIDDYKAPLQNLSGCEAAAERVADLFATNYHEGAEKGKPNFSCKLLTADTCGEKVTRVVLKEQIIELFDDEETEVALLFFTGYGFENSLGGYLMTQDATEHEEGVSFNDIMIYANNSSIREIIIILDCYFAKKKSEKEHDFGSYAALRKGVSVLTVSNNINPLETTAYPLRFPEILCHVLESGGDDDVLGAVTIAEIYAYADRILSPLGDDIVFKSNVSRIPVLRISKPQIPYNILKKMTTYFYNEGYRVSLDPECLRSQQSTNEVKIRRYKNLQKMVRCGLVKPINEVHMYYAALHNKHCGLTEKGKQYWHLFNENRI